MVFASADLIAAALARRRGQGGAPAANARTNEDDKGYTDCNDDRKCAGGWDVCHGWEEHEACQRRNRPPAAESVAATDEDQAGAAEATLADEPLDNRRHR